MADAEHLTKDEFLAHMGPIREDIKELVQLQRLQNGRVSKAETRLAILEDRSPGRIAGAVSALISGIMTGLGLWYSGK